jgi:hypothetical protein
MRFAAVISSGCLATVLHDVANQSLGKAGGDRVRVQRLAVAFQQLRHPTAFFGAVATGLRTFGHVFVVRDAFAGLGASRATSGAALWLRANLISRDTRRLRGRLDAKSERGTIGVVSKSGTFRRFVGRFRPRVNE